MLALAIRGLPSREASGGGGLSRERLRDQLENAVWHVHTMAVGEGISEVPLICPAEELD